MHIALSLLLFDHRDARRGARRLLEASWLRFVSLADDAAHRTRPRIGGQHPGDGGPSTITANARRCGDTSWETVALIGSDAEDRVRGYLNRRCVRLVDVQMFGVYDDWVSASPGRYMNRTFTSAPFSR